MSAVRIVIAGGGTGGHLYPGLAIAEAVRRLAPESEVLFVGGQRLEARVVPAEGWPFRAIAGRGLPRRPSVGAILALAAAAVGSLQALRLLWEWRPDVVVATGGYVCAPVGAASVVLGVPLVLQEQNLRPGLANRLLSRWARWVSVPHADAGPGLKTSRVEVTGVPLRRKAVEGDRRRGLARWGLEPDRLTLLVVGGSQGARTINHAVCQLGNLLMSDSGVQILHQTGSADLDEVHTTIGRRNHVGPPALRHVAVPFLDPIGDAYACADLVLCRAGASTLAEITAWGLPALLVPYPHAGAHQEENAAVLIRAGAAARLADADLTDTVLANRVAALFRDPARRGAMADASRRLGHRDAAEVVARLVLGVHRAGVVQGVRA